MASPPHNRPVSPGRRSPSPRPPSALRRAGSHNRYTMQLCQCFNHHVLMEQHGVLLYLERLTCQLLLLLLLLCLQFDLQAELHLLSLPVAETTQHPSLLLLDSLLHVVPSQNQHQLLSFTCTRLLCGLSPPVSASPSRLTELAVPGHTHLRQPTWGTMHEDQTAESLLSAIGWLAPRRAA